MSTPPVIVLGNPQMAQYIDPRSLPSSASASATSPSASTRAAATTSAMPLPHPRYSNVVRPLKVEQVRNGWNAIGNMAYTIAPCDIDGQIPNELNGIFFRNGPNGLDNHGTKLLHPIDSDGVVCSLVFMNGSVAFQSRSILTKESVEEAQAGCMLYRGQMGSSTWRSIGRDMTQVATKLKSLEMPSMEMRNPSNTSCMFWGGKLLSCYETGMPYALDPITLCTLGIDNLNGELRDGQPLCAHYRIDTERNRLIVASFSSPIAARKGMLTMLEFDAQWNCVSRREVSPENMRYVHDFLVTPNHYVLHISPFVHFSYLDLARVMVHNKAPSDLMRHYAGRPSKIMIIPRDTHSGASIRYLDIDACHIFHFGHAFETDQLLRSVTSPSASPSASFLNSETKTGGSGVASAATSSSTPRASSLLGNRSLVFTAVCLDPKFRMTFDQGIGLSNATQSPGVYYRFDCDLVTNTITRVVLEASSCEFPTVNPTRHVVTVEGRAPPPRYAYLMCSDTAPLTQRRVEKIPYRDIVKVDALASRRWIWHSNGVVGEPLFIPRNAPSSPTMAARNLQASATPEEDQGWILVQVYIPETHTTDFVLLDAQSIENGPICRIKLKHHVPYGFHGCFAPFAPSSSSYASSSSSASSAVTGASLIPHPLSSLVLSSGGNDSPSFHMSSSRQMSGDRRSSFSNQPARCIVM